MVGKDGHECGYDKDNICRYHRNIQIFLYEGAVMLLCGFFQNDLGEGAYEDPEKHHEGVKEDLKIVIHRTPPSLRLHRLSQKAQLRL